MDWFLLACSALLAVAMAVNLLDRRMLLLTAMVGVGFYWPQPTTSAAAFYTSCIAAEVLVGVAALVLDRKRGFWIADISLALVISHIMGFVIDGSIPASPYHSLVKLLEFSQIVACVALSPVIAPILRNRDEATT